MRSLLILVFFGCFVVLSSSRPATLDEGDDSELEEAEYEGGGDGAANDSVRDDDESRVSEQESNTEGQEEETLDQSLQNTFDGDGLSNRAPDDGHSAREKNDNLPDFKSNRNSEEEKVDESDNEYQSLPEPRQPNEYFEKNDPNDVPETAQHLTNKDDDFKLTQDKNNLEPRTTSNDEGDFLFENKDNNRGQFIKSDKKRYNNNPAYSNEQTRNFKQYYNKIQAENRDIYENEPINLNRDRRQAQDSLPKETKEISDSTRLNESPENSTDDEEASIKRHVKKLSGEEFQELLNSLSEEKKELLKKIMETESESSNDSINKREITKKAGAVEENSFMENGQSDASKLQCGPGDVNTDNPINPTADTSKQPDINDLSQSITKTLEASNTSASPANKPESTIEESKQVKSDSNLNAGAPSSESKNEANIDVTTKTENKREVNVDDISNMELSFDDTKFENDLSLKDSPDSLNDPGYICSQNEDLPQLTNSDISFLNENGNTIKREAILERESDFSDSIKSLEESFPNSNAYDESDPYAGSDMAPLVRVKRKNEDAAVKKRAAALLPDVKVAFLPYRAENDDEDNDEGNEFDDEGFYDRTSNFAKIEANDNPEEESLNNFAPSRHFLSGNRNPQANLLNRSKLSQDDNLESDTMSLGSDTDNVLSGVEGVDDNLMFNSGARNRRTAEETKEKQPSEASDVELNRLLRSTPFLDDEIKPGSENKINTPNYQENDAFGPLPRNYEGELGRYKRIRRVKQSPALQEVAST